MYILCHLADPNNYGTQRVVWCALFCVNHRWSCQNARRSRPSLSTLRSRSSSLEAARAECASMELRTASSAARRVAGARGPRRTCRRCNYQIPAQSRRRSEELTESHLATTKRKPARNGRPAILPSGPAACSGRRVTTGSRHCAAISCYSARPLSQGGRSAWTPPLTEN